MIVGMVDVSLALVKLGQLMNRFASMITALFPVFGPSTLLYCQSLAHQHCSVSSIWPINIAVLLVFWPNNMPQVCQCVCLCDVPVCTGRTLLLSAV